MDRAISLSKDGINRWQQVQLLPEGTSLAVLYGRPDQLDSVFLELDGIRYHRVPDTGFTMLIAWFAGPERLVRLHNHDPHIPIDQKMIDEGIEEYLVSAGVSAPPRHHCWYQRIPETHHSREDFYASINVALRDADPDDTANKPNELTRLLPGIVADLYTAN